MYFANLLLVLSIWWIYPSIRIISSFYLYISMPAASAISLAYSSFPFILYIASLLFFYIFVPAISICYKLASSRSRRLSSINFLWDLTLEFSISSNSKFEPLYFFLNLFWLRSTERTLLFGDSDFYFLAFSKSMSFEFDLADLKFLLEESDFVFFFFNFFSLSGFIPISIDSSSPLTDRLLLISELSSSFYFFFFFLSGLTCVESIYISRSF